MTVHDVTRHEVQRHDVQLREVQQHDVQQHDVRRQRLEQDFAELATIERLQDYHRRELVKREQLLRSRQRDCDELEAHLAWRLRTLLLQGQVLQRTSTALDAEVHEQRDNRVGFLPRRARHQTA